MAGLFSKPLCICSGLGRSKVAAKLIHPPPLTTNEIGGVAAQRAEGFSLVVACLALRGKAGRSATGATPASDFFAMGRVCA